MSSFGDWRPIETAPRDGTVILVWWPCFKLDDDMNLTDQQVGGGKFITFWQAGGWIEPDSQEAVGAFFGDDHEFGADPTLWTELPPDPVN